jgi:hypothetical protein
MDPPVVIPVRSAAFSRTLAALLLAISQCACQRASDRPAEPTATAAAEAAHPGTQAAKEPLEPGADGDESEGQGITLKPEEVRSLGIVVSPARSTSHALEVSGFAIVGTHEAIAQALMELVTAAAAERQSRAALDRAQRLAGTPGAMSAETLESAKRQATVDEASSLLARQKLSASFGEKAPWDNRLDSSVLRELANGKVKLVRVTFPLGSLDPAQSPSSLRLSRLDGSGSARGWTVRSVWSAPADTSIPGSSFFALLGDSTAREGERLLAFAPIGPVISGVWVPASATVISDSKYWCYIETKPGVFARRELDTTVPLDQGYFIKEGIAPGENVVTASAGLLLARETNPATEAD